MNKTIKNISRTFLLLSVVAISFSSCTQVDNKDIKNLSYGTCEGCHTDYQHLKLVHTPDTAAPIGGCGGTAPHFEPYDRVYMGGSGYDAYKGTVHDMDCTKCHNGVDNTSSKEKAHSGDFLKHPSSEYVDKCGKCHSDLTDNFATNLHNGIGQMDKVTKRSGLTGHAQFADLPQHQQEGYTAKCATCHGTCGNCHVVRPTLAGGGLAKGHQFIQEPTMTTCVSCHSSRGGHAYLGQGVDQDPTIVKDVHLTDAGFNKCTYCHTEVEIHGTGEAVDHRYEYSALPSCTATECHPDVNGSTGDNGYHKAHLETFNCQVCHSQDYNNCGECHVNGDDARVPHHLSFKIALNPLQDPDENHDFPLALVRRTLGAPDNWERYDATYDQDDFNVFPMFNYTTPHNIIEHTTRTVAGVDTYPGCTLNCHIWDDNGTLQNKELYLLIEDFDPLKPWQESSTSHITLDSRLSGWLTK